MTLEIPQLPIAGTNFSVMLKGYTGHGHLAIYINNQMALEQDCDDPPCHEIIFLTRDLAGRSLRVLAIGGDQTEEAVFTIGMKEAGGGAVMAK